MMTMMNFQRRSWSNWGLHCDRLDAGEDEAGLHHRHHHHYHQRCHYDHYDHQNNNNGHNNQLHQEKTLDVYGHVTCLRAQRNYMVG